MASADELLAAIELLRVSDPVTLWQEREAIESAIRRTEWPHLEFVPETADSPAGFKCPHCGALLNSTEGDNTLAAVDIAERWTSFDTLTDKAVSNQAAYIVYDDPGEFDGLTYQCGACSRPVSLPEGWTEAVGW